MISKLTMKQYASRVTRQEFTFQKGLNLLVGPNGSGKSSVLRSLREGLDPKNKKSEKIALIEGDREEEFVLYWASEEHPRLPSAFDPEYDMLSQVQSIFSSRGQAQTRTFQDWLMKTKSQAKGAIYLLDEPDVSLDLPRVEDLITLFRYMCALPSQVIVAVHHPLLVLHPSAHIIELEEGFIDKTKALFRPLL